MADLTEGQRSELPEAYDKVFYPLDGPTIFRNPLWESMLLPYHLHLDKEVAHAFLSAVAQVGDEMLTVTDIEPIPPHQDTRRIPAVPEALTAVRVQTILGHVDTRLVGDSGRWGGEEAHDGLLLLGGDTTFMSTLMSRGGVDSFRDRYERFMRDEWMESDSAARLRSAVRWPIPSAEDRQ